MTSGLFCRRSSTSSLNAASITPGSSPNSPPPSRVKPVTVLHRQVQLLRHRVELRQRGERLVGELLRLVVEDVLRALLAIVRFDFGTRLVERLHVPGLDLLRA